MIIIDESDALILNRMAQRYANINSRVLAARNAAKDNVDGLALDGFALLYDQPLIYDNEIWVFEAGCFSDSLRVSKEIFFQIDHDTNRRVASTRNALSFSDDEIGLAFRLGLDDLKQGAELKRMVDAGRRAAVSVGIKNDESHIKMFGKHPVRIITKAELFEISLVGAGKCPNAFVGVVNADFEPLERGKKGSMFTINFTAHKLKRMKRAASNHSEALRSIASTLDRSEGKAQPVEKTKKTESNIDKWYRSWNASFDAATPAITKWAKSRGTAA
jgi:HK97 family phage prohead protease